MKALHATVALAAILFFATPAGLDSCGIAAPLPVFAPLEGPGDVSGFLKGKLGVLRRTFQPRHLIGAFRVLSGIPLTQSEVDSLYQQSGDSSEPYSGASLNAWMDARRAVPRLGPAAAIDPSKKISADGFLMYFMNCKQDAFATATATLAELNQAWGSGDPRTLEWAAAQDQVFSNCSGLTPEIPAPPAANMEPLLAAHRRYQIAAALFYSGQLRKASKAFEQIAADAESPWRGFAPYLAGRALLRAGLLDGDRNAFREGKDRLLAVANDPEQEEWHESSLNLIQLWRIRVEPLKRVDELNRKLMQPSDEDISQSVTDLIYLVSNRIYGGARPWSKSELSAVEEASELAAWLLFMSTQPPVDAGERCVEWWRRGRNPAWLIASLANAQENDLDELLTAARQIAPSSPAYESVAYYAVARETGRGRRESARNWADRALRQNLSPGSRNSIAALRMQTARNWDEFLRFSLRSPEPKLENYEGHEVIGNTPMLTGTAPVFDWDVIDAFNMQVPLSLWVNASANKLLPPQMQLRIAQAGWSRALMLGKVEDARNLMQRILDLQPGATDVANGFLSARDAEEARFAALYVILRTPGLRPTLLAPELKVPDLAKPRYIYTDTYGYKRARWDYRDEQRSKQLSISNLGFLTSAQRASAGGEWKQLLAAESWGATYLARETLAWARKHPDDKRIPEALHRAVQASYYRLTDKDTGRYSKQAFDLLHRQYPKSEWTARTKYWYK